MSEVLIAQIFDAATGESNTRPLTAEEIADLEAQNAAYAARQAEAEAKVAARESAAQKLSSILNPEEIAALFG